MAKRPTRRPRRTPRKTTPTDPRPVNALDLTTLISDLQAGTHSGTIEMGPLGGTHIHITRLRRPIPRKSLRSRPRFVN